LASSLFSSLGSFFKALLFFTPPLPSYGGQTLSGLILDSRFHIPVGSFNDLKIPPRESRLKRFSY